MGRMQGKIAIVTGGARGMGAATARKFVEEGATVVIADMLEAEGNALATELGGQNFFHALNVTDEASWQTLVAAVQARFGHIDRLHR